MIELRNLSGGYDGVTVVKDISTRFLPHSLNVLIGPNGCGKSTLMRLAAGLIHPTGGAVLLDGENIRNIQSQTLAKRIAYLPQSRNTYTIAVKNLVLHGRFPHLGYPRRYRKEDIAIARNAMEQMEIAHLAEHSMDTLSGGERQKAYIAMMLAQGGEVFFMDEPTTYLDIARQLEVVRIAQELKKTGKTLVLILHDLNMAMRCADRIFVMKNGAICFEGAPEAVFAAGILDKVFEVKVGTADTPDSGTQYYFTQKSTGNC